MIKLNLGCGDMIVPGYINCDLFNPKAEIRCDVSVLPFDDNYANEIYASHVIEHFNFQEGLNILKEWRRVLKESGQLIIETPDLYKLCVRFISASEQARIELYPQFFGYPWIAGQTHLFLYTKTQLEWSLQQMGFKNIIEKRAIRFLGLEDICLKLESIK